MGLTDFPGSTVGTSYLVPGARDLPGFLQLSADPRTVEFIGAGSEAQAGHVAPAGDFNADGLADFLIGSPGNFFDEPGVVYLVFGRKGFADRVEMRDLRGLGVVIHGTIPVGYPSVPVRERGDHDGDGVDDIVLSERGLNDTAGRVHVVFGTGRDRGFIRGDANRDGAVDVSDAATIMGYLFLGVVGASCEDAMDADDLGSLELTDAVYLLSHLFLGGPAPPPPYPRAGVDPTADALGCGA